MKIDLSQNNPTVDAIDLAKGFELSPDEVQRLMREGAITSRFETGVGEDEGTFRLTFWHAGTKLRFICDDAGLVRTTSRVRT